MQALRFAATKIQPPRQRTQRVERARLDAALAQALHDARVVLLQAPAGFGKTSVLAAQLARLPAGHAAAWVSLDADDDAERLFACLAAALEPLDLPWRTSPEALTALAGQGGADLRRAAAELVNALADSGAPRGLIVLDDLHRAADPGIAALLDALVERLPPRWTLLLASRTAPPLALARWRAAGELAEFNQDDLRFDRAEAAALVAAEALPQASERADELFERTAGWPAGLRLALAALRTRGAAGPGRLLDRHLFDYLAAEVLDDMPPALHDFLLRCAVLPELTAARAAEVSGDRRAEAWLDEIERRGLFATALDATERTLVLHDLFRDALLARLRQRLPHELPALLQRAAAGEADALRRVGFLLRAEDWAGAEAALTAAAEQLFVQGGAGEVLRLVEQFPPAQRDASPRLLRLAAMAHGLRWQWLDVVRLCESARAAALASGDAAERQRAEAYLTHALYPLDRNDEVDRLVATLRGEGVVADARWLALMSDCHQCYRHGTHDLLVERYAELLAGLQGSDSLLLWWQCVPVVNWTTIAGMPALIDRYLAAVLPRIGERPLPMRGELRLLRAFQALWAGRIDAARADLQEADDDMKWLAVSGEMAWAADMLRLFIAAMSGQAGPAQALLQKKLARHDGAPDDLRRFGRHQVAIYGVRITGTLGSEPAALRHWASMIRENPIEDATTWNPRAWVVRARYAAAQGRWADAWEHFERLLPKLHEMDVMGQRTDLTLRAGLVLVRLGRLADAATVVGPVLDRLIAEGVRGQALMCGPGPLQALAETRWGALLNTAQQAELAAAARLSASLQGDAPAAAGSAAGAAGVDRWGISAREREVLERLAAGDSNKLIARVLDISPHTVKRHVANILDKLGLSSRGQAAAWLRDHG